VDEELFRFARQLASELGMKGLFKNANVSTNEDARDERYDPLSSLSGKVAIYTLTESAGIRAKNTLRMRSPLCKVELSHDKSGNAHLRDLARSADIFVVATSSAKHAATIFIETNRLSKNSLIRPLGKGTSSILKALVDYLSVE
jgi:hypothetical protein